MAGKTVVAFEATLESNQAQESVKSFKQRLKEATADVTAMTEKFGATSREAAAAAKNVAKLKDTMGDAKALSDSFNPDKKFVALGGALQGATAGFSALQGAMGLFGAESEQTQKLLLKVQSAMALQQGISGIAGAVDSFKLLGNTIKTSVVTAFSTLKGAIAATGIGLLVIGITAVIANFDKLKNASGWIGKIFGGIGDAISWVTDKLSDLGDWLGITGGDEEELAARTEAAQNRIKNAKEAAYDNELRVAQAVGKGVAEIEKRKRDEQMKTLANQYLILTKMQKFFGDDFNADAIANIKIEYEKLLTDQKVADITAHNKRMAQKVDLGKAEAEVAGRIGSDLLDVQKQIEADIAAAEESAEWARMQRASQAREWDLAEQMYYDDLDIKAAENRAKAKIKIEEELYQQKQAFMQATATGLGALSDIVGKETAAGKALAVAQSLINTYAAIVGQLRAATKSPGAVVPGWAIAQAIATGVVGFAAVKNILKVQVPGGSGGSSGGSVPSIGSVSAPIQPQQQSTLINQSQINQIGNAAARAYVIESDVSGNQERVRRLNRAARIN